MEAHRVATTRSVRKLVFSRAISVIAIAAATLTGCATNPVTGEREVNLVSEEKEIQIGKENDAAVRKQYGVYNAPALQAYVNEVGQKLAKHSQRANLEWHFTIVDSPDINAFALPGGYVYITRGLMAYLDSEEELAGVIGHEIGHVTARHGAQRETQGTIAQALSIGAEILGQVVGGVQGAGQAVAGAASQWMLTYGRDQELQADQLGATYLAGNGYDPKGMIKVIGVLKNQEVFAADRARAEGKTVQKMPDWGSTHPSNDQRLHDIVEIANKLKVQGATDAGRDRYLRAINGMTFGESREQGVVRGNSFMHEPMGIAFSVPDGWKLRNSADTVVAINAAGTVGVAMALVTGAGANDEDIIRKIFKPQAGQAKATQINGLPTTYFVGRAVDEKGQAVPLELTLIDYNKQTYLFRSMFKSVEAHNAAAPELRAVINSFHPITPTERQQARPFQIRTLPLASGQNVGALARSAPLGRYAEQELRLVNGIYPQGELAAGRLVKTIAQ